MTESKRKLLEGFKVEDLNTFWGEMLTAMLELDDACAGLRVVASKMNLI